MGLDSTVTVHTMVGMKTDTTSVHVQYRRVAHAAHYAHVDARKGHDLETWTVRAQTVAEARELAGSELPRDAEYHCGYLDGGQQFWIFVRRAPLSAGHCPRCAPNSSPTP